jgi:hypothetical protein
MSKQSTAEQMQLWKEKISEQQESGLPVANWCRKNNIHAHIFYYWKKKLDRPSLCRASFTELTEIKKSNLILEYREIRLLIDPCFDPATLKRCLEVIKEIA